MTDLYRIFENTRGVATDSRRVREGSLFFALRGENFDGNRFAAEALAAGAAYAVVDDPGVARGDKYILVENTLTTLQHLATYHRRVLAIPVLAITGTNGKTTTKELVTRVLSGRYRVAATEGNLNNHIGVPLTILSVNRGTEFAVVEMGASARGEIGMLCSIAQPDFGIITNIGRAHLEGFGSEEGVRQAKGELYDYLASHNGLAFYRKDDPVLEEMVGERPRMLAKGYTSDNAEGLRSNLYGSYNISNIAAAAAIGEYFGVVKKKIAEAVENYSPDNRRSQVLKTAKNTLIMDCYNANPSSMKAAIESLSSMSDSLTKAAVLGDMLELGKYSQDEHMAVLSTLAAEHIREVYLVGSNFISAADGTGIKVFRDAEALRRHFENFPLKGYTVLVKGSRGMALEKAVENL
ncbi:MAG: Mur ligase domain-containing protein [Rikenellaceae bacterium]|nr:Mur ligase domain-containing protein [Rikenellaceae bacterium]